MLTASPPPAFQYPQQTSQDAFRTSMQMLKETCVNDPKITYKTFNLSVKLGFHRRRFYDVVNVLEAAGCCKKVDSETISWKGMENIRNNMLHLALANGAFSKNSSLAEIIPAEFCISISKVTEYYLLCFLALQTQYLDLKDICKYLSRNTERYKTTLCKLYQITHILESAGIVSKTEKISQVKLNDEFFIQVQFSLNENVTPLSLTHLLSRPVGFKPDQCILERRKDFFLAQNNLFAKF